MGRAGSRFRNASPRALRCCVAHKMRNLASKVPEDVWPEFKARAAAIRPPRHGQARGLKAHGLGAAARRRPQDDLPARSAKRGGPPPG
jgi:hypothetical protein